MRCSRNTGNAPSANNPTANIPEANNPTIQIISLFGKLSPSMSFFVLESSSIPASMTQASNILPQA